MRPRPGAGRDGPRRTQRQAQASRAGMASLGATSLNWAPVGSVGGRQTTVRRVLGGTRSAAEIDDLLSAASVSATPK